MYIAQAMLKEYITTSCYILLNKYLPSSVDKEMEKGKAIRGRKGSTRKRRKN
jgi:hypothetical protein